MEQTWIAGRRVEGNGAVLPGRGVLGGGRVQSAGPAQGQEGGARGKIKGAGDSTAFCFFLPGLDQTQY